ncbi:MAG: SGNH/GDSL hydrolase family protein [Prevotellaceae bacterium]|nr:SGNH/GDSL hydrolase family protein [Prevotellaceae bacterium]
MSIKKMFICMAAMVLSATAQAKGVNENRNWVATWATATEYTGKGDMPKSGTLDGKSIRQIVHVSIGGKTLRLHLSNEYSKEPVEIKSVFVADIVESEDIKVADIGIDIQPKTARYLKFNGKRNLTIAAGETAVSDPVAYDLKPLQRLAITISYGKTPVNATSHRGSRTTSYIINGEAKPKTTFANIEREDHWYNIATIDVIANDCSAIACIGNSITDGRGTTTNLQNRWTDFFAEALQASETTSNLAVLNLGIGGNSVFYGGLSDPAVKRFDRDCLEQAGVKTIVVYEGINDLGGTNNDAEARAAKIIECYKEFIRKAHQRGMKIYGATIAPYFGSFYDNGDFFREAARQTINKWIRESGQFDGVIDFDSVLRDPANPSKMNPAYHCGDWLHPNPAGFEAMGKFAAKIFTK